MINLSHNLSEFYIAPVIPTHPVYTENITVHKIQLSCARVRRWESKWRICAMGRATNAREERTRCIPYPAAGSRWSRSEPWAELREPGLHRGDMEPAGWPRCAALSALHL